MKNPKKLFIAGGIVLVVIIALIIGGKIQQANKSTEPSTEMILFYGDTCPHCKVVKQYIKANKVRDYLKFQELEVYNNRKNAILLGRYAHRCGINTQSVGVPFFWTGKTCLIGQDKVINFFKKR